MNKTAYVKYQYPLVQFLYWVTCCSCNGFVAVYLQYKGFSNTVIGIVVGIAGILSLIVQPVCSKIIEQVSFLTVRKMLMILLIFTGMMFSVITVWHLAGMFTVIGVILINACNSSMIPLVNSFGMEYVNQKRDVNYGLARGFGSLGWAVSAAVIGFLLEKFSPELLGYIYVFSVSILLINIWFMEDLGRMPEDMMQNQTEEKERGLFWKCLRDTTFLFVALGIMLDHISHSLCTTYTINIVQNVGGTENAVGMAQFFGAASEMVGMLIFAGLAKKYSNLQILKISSIFFVIRFGFLIFTRNLPMVMIGYILQGPSEGFYLPAAVYFVNERMLPKNRTQGQVIFNIIAGSIANFAGNLLGGRMLDQIGLQYTLVACFVFASVGCICIMTRKETERSIA